MKNTAIHAHPVRYRRQTRPCRVPNAADPNYFVDRIIDGALAVATGMGTLAILFFLITL